MFMINWWYWNIAMVCKKVSKCLSHNLCCVFLSLRFLSFPPSIVVCDADCERPKIFFSEVALYLNKRKVTWNLHVEEECTIISFFYGNRCFNCFSWKRNMSWRLVWVIIGDMPDGDGNFRRLLFRLCITTSIWKNQCVLICYMCLVCMIQRVHQFSPGAYRAAS